MEEHTSAADLLLQSVLHGPSHSLCFNEIGTSQTRNGKYSLEDQVFQIRHLSHLLLAIRGFRRLSLALAILEHQVNLGALAGLAHPT